MLTLCLRSREVYRTLICGKWIRTCDPYVWEVEKGIRPLCLCSGEGHVTPMVWEVEKGI
jgi:hypothetical protein